MYYYNKIFIINIYSNKYIMQIKINIVYIYLNNIDSNNIFSQTKFSNNIDILTIRQYYENIERIAFYKNCSVRSTLIYRQKGDEPPFRTRNLVKVQIMQYNTISTQKFE